jgi:uncharacterized protein YaiI (UPF0178 family)
MKVISIRDIEDGMVLAKAIANEKGKVLYDKGTIFTGKLVSEMFQQGITEVCIRTEEDEHHMPEAVYKRYNVKNDKELEEKIRSEVQARFGQASKGDPVMQKIMRLAEKFELRRIGLDV